MVKEEIVFARLDKFRKYVGVLKSIGKQNIQVFKEDPIIHGAAERYLQLAIESLLDIGNHLIADRGLRKPSTYADILEILTEEKIISATLSKNLEGVAAFRNILVHDYIRIDLDKVYGLLQNKIKYLEQLGKVFGKLA